MTVCDPFFDNAVLLLEFDGTSGQTTTIDSSSFAWPVTLLAGAGTLSTADPKFGTANFDYNGSSGAFNNNACSIPFTLGSALDIFASNDWTIEGQFKLPTAGAATLANYGANATTPSSIEFPLTAVDNNDGTTSVAWSDGNMFGTVLSISGTITTPSGLWHSFALVNDAGTAKLYIDGVSIGTPVVGHWIPANYSNPNASPTICIGNNVRLVSNGACSIDEFRVSNVARYTADYTPPFTPFPDIPCGVSPPVAGTSLSDAEATIVAAGFVVGTITCEIDDSVPVGTVISQDPAAGAPISPGESIDLTVYCLGDKFLSGKFVSALVGKAIMIADPGNIHPRIYPPARPTTMRIK